MTKTRTEGNGYFFCVGFLFFSMGVVFLSLLLYVKQIESPHLVLGLALICIVGSLFTYGGLALLLQAGLGAFWNDVLGKEAREKSKSTPEFVDLDGE